MLGAWNLELYLNPLSNNSALVFVACRLSISFSIASIGGSAAIVLRKHLHAFPFIGMIQQLLAPGRRLHRMDRRVKPFLLPAGDQDATPCCRFP